MADRNVISLYGRTVSTAREPLTIPSRPVIRRLWQETKSVQQVAERTGISLSRAHRLITEMVSEEGLCSCSHCRSTEEATNESTR